MASYEVITEARRRVDWTREARRTLEEILEYVYHLELALALVAHERVAGAHR